MEEGEGEVKETELPEHRGGEEPHTTGMEWLAIMCRTRI